MSDILRKVTSRKFLLAVIGMVVSVAVTNDISGSEINELVGLIVKVVGAAGCAITYITAEAKVDAAREANISTIVCEDENADQVVVEGFR